VILPEDRWWAAEPKWRAAEEYGFAHAWALDRPGPPASPEGPWFAAVPTLAAAALVTGRIRLGTFLTTPDLRHPVPFARELLTLDDLSDGRLTATLGPGAGPAGPGGEPLGPADRTARFGEFADLLDRLLAQDRTTARGRFYAADDARSAPGCVQRPRLPFVVAADDPATMAVAARRGAGWLTEGPAAADDDAWWRGVARLVERFDEVLPAGGRAGFGRYLSADAGPVYSLTSVERFRDVVGRAAELGFSDVVVHWPGDDGRYAGREQVLEQVAADVLPGLVTP